MPAEYITQRIRRETVDALRKYEKKNKLDPSISNTIEELLEKAKELRASRNERKRMTEGYTYD